MRSLSKQTLHDLKILDHSGPPDTTIFDLCGPGVTTHRSPDGLAVQQILCALVKCSKESSTRQKETQGQTTAVLQLLRMRQGGRGDVIRQLCACSVGPHLLSPPVWLHRRMNWSTTWGKRCRRRWTPVSASECRLGSSGWRLQPPAAHTRCSCSPPPAATAPAWASRDEHAWFNTFKEHAFRELARIQ